MSRIVGIDPGLTGAIALVVDGDLISVTDMPVQDGRVIGANLRSLLMRYRPDAVFVEKQHAMPKNGSIASFSLGYNTSAIHSAVESLGFTMHEIPAQTWKKALGLTGTGKTGTLERVRNEHPAHEANFARAKDHGRADAVMIARYGHLWSSGALNA